MNIAVFCFKFRTRRVLSSLRLFVSYFLWYLKGEHSKCYIWSGSKLLHAFDIDFSKIYHLGFCLFGCCSSSSSCCCCCSCCFYCWLICYFPWICLWFLICFLFFQYSLYRFLCFFNFRRGENNNFPHTFIFVSVSVFRSFPFRTLYSLAFASLACARIITIRQKGTFKNICVEKWLSWVSLFLFYFAWISF